MFSSIMTTKKNEFAAEIDGNTPVTTVINLQGLIPRYKQSNSRLVKYFQNPGKCVEIIELLKNTEEKNTIMLINELFKNHSNTVLLAHVHKIPKVIELLVEIIESIQDFRAGIATQIIKYSCELFTEKFFMFVETLPLFFVSIVKNLSKPSVFDLFSHFLSFPPVKMHSYLYGIVYGLLVSMDCSGSSLVLPPAWKSLTNEALAVYKSNLNFDNFLNTSPKSFISLMRIFSSFIKDNRNFLDMEDMESCIDGFSQIIAETIPFFQYSQYFENINDRSLSKNRGTIKDDCLAELINLYSLLPPNESLVGTCFYLIDTPFVGSNLNIAAINYFAKHSSDSIFSSKTEFVKRILFRIFYIPYDLLYQFLPTDDPIHSRLIKDMKPNNLVMQAGLKLIERVVRIEDEKIKNEMKALIMKLILIIWNKSLNENQGIEDFLLIQSFLIQICLRINKKGYGVEKEENKSLNSNRNNSIDSQSSGSDSSEENYESKPKNVKNSQLNDEYEDIMPEDAPIFYQKLYKNVVLPFFEKRIYDRSYQVEIDDEMNEEFENLFEFIYEKDFMAEPFSSDFYQRVYDEEEDEAVDDSENDT
ncbi:hypothetical protein TRFO_28317 [Tritrichomonas foetus]|uniref:Uncharacterized protein n=1 Tax=Tritrichomonas foetus TaxID=1144522 RepID=A0A1J4K3B0_9EUKA|nr:hypothetical protein TRFO_28317 [Tritrichomonas foetus]|eukprot:OHT04214.1 hypothetical protein TRFO_28317 [Tritrichomonas foetus]